jgi:rhamnosyl/mannosyltransferase
LRLSKTIARPTANLYPQALLREMPGFQVAAMKVVHIFKDCYPPTTGGIEQHMSLLCRRLAETMDVTILAPSRSRRRVEESIARVQILRVPEFGRYASAPLCPTAPLELRRLHPDIVHLHFPNPMGDLTHLLGAASRPLVVTYHADIIKQKALLPLYRPILNLLFKKARRIIFSAAENIILSAVPPACRNKCTVIPFGVEPEAFSPNGPENSDIESLREGCRDGVLVLFVGAARYYKGIEVLLRAMVHVKGRLALAGRDTQSDAIQSEARDLGIHDRTLFCGEVPESRLRVLLNAADIFVLPSIDRCETFGIGQLEAMACSKPVISTDLPTGVRSVNRHGVTGLVVSAGDPDALAGALNLLVSNPALRAEFGRNARKRVELEFCADRMVSKTSEVYRGVLGR